MIWSASASFSAPLNTMMGRFGTSLRTEVKVSIPVESGRPKAIRTRSIPPHFSRVRAASSESVHVSTNSDLFDSMESHRTTNAAYSAEPSMSRTLTAFKSEFMIIPTDRPQIWFQHCLFAACKRIGVGKFAPAADRYTFRAGGRRYYEEKAEIIARNEIARGMILQVL